MNTKSSRMLASMKQHLPRQTKIYSHPPHQWLWQDSHPVLKHMFFKCSLSVSKLKGGLEINELICQLRKGIKNRGRRRWRTSDFLTTNLASFLLYTVTSKYCTLYSKERFFLWYTLYHAYSLLTLPVL